MNAGEYQINVALTKAVLDDTRWFMIDAEVLQLPDGLKGFTQVFATPQLPDVLLAKTEKGDFFWFKDVNYSAADPFTLIAFMDAWNREHGHV